MAVSRAAVRRVGTGDGNGLAAGGVAAVTRECGARRVFSVVTIITFSRLVVALGVFSTGGVASPVPEHGARRVCSMVTNLTPPRLVVALGVFSTGGVIAICPVHGAGVFLGLCAQVAHPILAASWGGAAAIAGVLALEQQPATYALASSNTAHRTPLLLGVAEP